MNDIGVKVAVMTFDGLSSNITSMETLGATFDLENMKPYILNPIDNSKIFILFDPPHMIKLMRNCIGAEKEMFDGDGRKISWKIYEDLHRISNEEQLATHKITKKHMDWTDNKMKVSLATQLFSNSVASSIEFLMEKGYTEFEDSAGTIEFTRRMNNLFDILNSKENADNEFKIPLCNANKENTFEYLKECVEYLRKLKFSSEFVCESPKKVGAKGLIIDILNVIDIYKEYVETNLLTNLPVYLLNQDQLESWFARMRAFNCLGQNTNPTTVQYCAAHRKNSVKSEITSSAFANYPYSWIFCLFLVKLVKIAQKIKIQIHYINSREQMIIVLLSQKQIVNYINITIIYK